MGERIGEVLEGKYRLGRVLGRGGMGLVYEAEHTVISRRMAVKMLHSEHLGSEEMAQRFLQEAKSASTIRHPNVIEIQDVGQAGDGAIFIVMELLQGRSLAALLKGGTVLAPERAVAVGRQILAGLAAAHEARIVHRDLKPDNVFLAAEELTGQSGERVKILDFGISKGVAGGPEVGLTRTGAVLGTAWYMAPEQARGDRDLDERADIWAVGVMLYQMLVGRLPFPGDSYNAVLAKILTDEVPSIQDALPSLDPALAAGVQKALTRDRSERYKSAAAFDEALRPFAPGPELLLPRVPEEHQEAVTSEVSTAQTLAADAGTAETAAVDAATAETAAVDVATAETRAQPEATAKTRAADPGAAFAPSRSEPAPVSRPATDTALPSSPLWKRLLWYVMTGPLVVGLLLLSVFTPVSIFRAFGVPKDLPTSIAILMAAALCAGLGWTTVVLAKAWQLGRSNRILHGAAVIAAPAVGLGLAMYHYLTLAGQKTSHQVSLRAYSAITEAHAHRMARLIGESHEQFLSAVAIDQLALALLGLMLLLGWLFHPRAFAGTHATRWSWLALPAGFAVIGLAHFVLFPRQLQFMGIAFFFCYLLWTLGTLVVLQQPKDPEEPASNVGWAALATALVTSAAITGSQVAAGYLQLFEVVGGKSATTLPPAEREVLFQAQVNPFMVRGVLLQWAVLMTLFVITWFFGRRNLDWPGPRGRKPLLIFAMAFAVTALPTPIVLGAMSSASDQWAPHKFTQMQPMAPPGETEPTFYIDRAPQSLALGHRLLYRALTRGKGRAEPTVKDVQQLLTARKACPTLLARTLGPKGTAQPARCVTAIEARIYCERLGKRLPTPIEWDTALAKVKPDTKKSASEMRRGAFGEWTMKKVHGTATFEIRGQTGAPEVPARLAPNRFSRHVGFRCAFTFK